MLKSIKKLSIAQAAYVAGIIDGEGTVSLMKQNSPNRTLSVAVANNDRSLLEWLKETVGAGNITNKRVRSPKHAASYAWRIHGDQALCLLSKITKYLLTKKRDRSLLILQYYRSLTPINGKYSPALIIRRSKFVEQVLSIKTRS